MVSCVESIRVFHADLGLDFCAQSAEGLQEGLILWFKSGASLHVFESHVQFAQLLQSLATPVQCFNICSVNVNCCDGVLGIKINNSNESKFRKILFFVVISADGSILVLILPLDASDAALL